MNLDFPNSKDRPAVERRVGSSAFARPGAPPDGGTPIGKTPSSTTLNPQPSTLNLRRAFTLVEILVVVVLLSFIVLALMAVFNSTQTAFRASITQTDVLEGGRSVMGLIRNDFESLSPSGGQSNVVVKGGYFGFIPATAPVNFCVGLNQYQYESNTLPLLQPLVGTSSTATRRTNVLQKFFLLTRDNNQWTGIGYLVDTTSTNYFNPLYRFVMTTNASEPKAAWMLYTNFLGSSLLPVSRTNVCLSHLLDGVMHLTVRAYDPDGYWMTNGYSYPHTNLAKNAWFAAPAWGEATCYLFSNTLPAAVSIELGVLEDQTIQRAQSLPGGTVRSNYLAQQAGKVHLFRQRLPIRNVDPSAYQ